MVESKLCRVNTFNKSPVFFIAATLLMSSSRSMAFSPSGTGPATIGTEITRRRKNSGVTDAAVTNVLENPTTRITRGRPRKDPLTEVETLPIDRDRILIYDDRAGTAAARKKRETPKKSDRTEVPRPSAILRKDDDVPKRSSRSSTMPGFRDKATYNKVARQKEIEFYENKTGKKVRRDTKRDSKKKVWKRSRDMYVGSATVPDSLVDFSDKIHKEERITAKEEKTLGVKNREALQLQAVYGSLESKLGRVPTDDEWCAAAGKINMESLRQSIDEGIEAKNKLVTANLRLVQAVVNTYIRNGLGSQYNAADLMQEGIVGLVGAAEKYEPDRGFRFSTYAMYGVRASVKRSQIVQSRPIYVPQGIHQTYKKIKMAEQDLVDDNGQKPSQAEIAEKCDLSEVQFERCVTAMKQQSFSLDQAISNPKQPQQNGQRESTLYDRVASKYDEEDYTPLEQGFVKEELINTLRRYLTAEELDMILLRYGLMDEKTIPHGFSGPLTFKEVSHLVGYKPLKVRRMINDSLKRLKPLIGDDWETVLA